MVAPKRYAPVLDVVTAVATDPDHPGCSNHQDPNERVTPDQGSRRIRIRHRAEGPRQPDWIRSTAVLGSDPDRHLRLDLPTTSSTVNSRRKPCAVNTQRPLGWPRCDRLARRASPPRPPGTGRSIDWRNDRRTDPVAAIARAHRRSVHTRRGTSPRPGATGVRYQRSSDTRANTPACGWATRRRSARPRIA